MSIEQATYAEILVSQYPDAVWSGSGAQYADIVWQSSPIPQNLLDLSVVIVARKREIRKATARIRLGAGTAIQTGGFFSAATGTLLHYSGDNEAFDYLTAQAVCSNTATSDTFLCVTDVGVSPHTASQVRVAHVDAVQARAYVYLRMMTQIAQLDSMTYQDIKSAVYVV